MQVIHYQDPGAAIFQHRQHIDLRNVYFSFTGLACITACLGLSVLGLRKTPVYGADLMDNQRHFPELLFEVMLVLRITEQFEVGTSVCNFVVPGYSYKRQKLHKSRINAIHFWVFVL